MKILPCITLSCLLSTIALAQSTHIENIKTLKSIPLVTGYEKKDSSEDSMTKELDLIFQKIVNESKNSNGSLNRGTHSKGSCFNGKITVFTKEELKNNFKYSDLEIEKIKGGLFAKDGEFNLEVRFANAKGQKNPDTAKDVKGMSFSIDTKGAIKDFSSQSRLDFMFNSSPMFAVKNLVEFYELMKAARTAQGDWYFLNPLYFGSTSNAKKLLDQFETNDTKSYATEEYWSNLPYVHGLNQNGQPSNIVKYKVTPCDGKGRISESSQGKSDNYLQQEILERVASNQICFYLQVQSFDKVILNKISGNNNSNTELIENSGELWDEKALPFKTIAKIEVPKSYNNGQISCSDKYFNTRLHATKENMPIGSLARVRTQIEEVSRARRMGEVQ